MSAQDRRALRPEPAPAWAGYVLEAAPTARTWAQRMREDPERARAVRGLCRPPGQVAPGTGQRQAAAVAEACALEHLNALPFRVAVKVDTLTVAVAEPGGGLYMAEVVVSGFVPLCVSAPPGRMSFVDLL